MSENGKVTVNKEYKDRLLNFIFGSEENRKWTLSLYNAINHSSYEDENEIQYNTIKEVLYLGMHNDTSFLISDMMNVYESQSSYNPNMPLRQLQYLGHLYEGYITENKMNKYGSELLKLPVPRLVVLYNGLKETEDEVILKLTDSFKAELREKSDVEVKVSMLNINYGHNKELLDACKPLSEYAWFIEKIRELRKNYEIEIAVSMAIDNMPDVFLLKSFLMIHRAEVNEMLLTEYNEAETMELFKEDGRREGRQEGIKEGRDSRDAEKISEMLKRGKTPEEISDFCGYPLEQVLKVQKCNKFK